jgi:hypothetical protein
MRRKGGDIDRVGDGDRCGNSRGMFPGFEWLDTVQNVSRGNVTDIIHDSSPSASHIEQLPGSGHLAPLPCRLALDPGDRAITNPCRAPPLGAGN